MSSKEKRQNLTPPSPASNDAVADALRKDRLKTIESGMIVRFGRKVAQELMKRVVEFDAPTALDAIFNAVFLYGLSYEDLLDELTELELDRDETRRHEEEEKEEAQQAVKIKEVVEETPSPRYASIEGLTDDKQFETLKRARTPRKGEYRDFKGKVRPNVTTHLFNNFVATLLGKHMRVARSFLKAYLCWTFPFLKDVDVDWNGIEVENTAFFEGGVERVCDLLFLIRYIDKKDGQEKTAPLVVLLEHKSDRDKNLPFQLFEYVARKLDYMRLYRDRYAPNGEPIPWPIVLVLYNGETPWIDPPKLQDVAQLPSFFPKEYEGRLPYSLIDLADDKTPILGNRWARVGVELLRLSRSPKEWRDWNRAFRHLNLSEPDVLPDEPPKELQAAFPSLDEFCTEEEAQALRSDFYYFVQRATLRNQNYSINYDYFIQTVEEQENPDMSTYYYPAHTVSFEDYDDGYADGVYVGKMQGKQIGEAIGEERGEKRGEKRGEIRGRLQSIKSLLLVLFPESSEELFAKIESISNLDALETIFNRSIKANSLDEVERLVDEQIAMKLDVQ